uniref:Uncharacterized protein n=1 Tax=Glossina pallidipes TaxID=7398 RepID=A0A1A9Z8L4_GLOPL
MNFELMVELFENPTLRTEEFSESSAANSRRRSDFSKRTAEEKERFEVMLNIRCNRILQVKGVEVVSSHQGTSNGKHRKSLIVHELGAKNVMNSNVINSLNIGALDKSPPQNIQNITASSIAASVSWAPRTIPLQRTDT